MTNTETAAQLDLDRNTIREVFLAHGFTIKPGQADLKQYVFEAAEALIAQARAQPAAAPIALSVNSGEGAPSVKTWQERYSELGTAPSEFSAEVRKGNCRDAEIADLRAQLAQKLQAAPHATAKAWMIWLHGPAGLFENKDAANLELERRNRLYPDDAKDRLLLELTAPTYAPQVIERAADMLTTYHAHLHRLSPINFDEHPYLPSIEEAAEDLRALASAPIKLHARLSESVCQQIAVRHANSCNAGEYYQFNSEGLDAFAIEIMDRVAAPVASHAQAEPVAEIDQGYNGCFQAVRFYKFVRLPIGTKLYTTPGAQAVERAAPDGFEKAIGQWLLMRDYCQDDKHPRVKSLWHEVLSFAAAPAAPHAQAEPVGPTDAECDVAISHALARIAQRLDLGVADVSTDTKGHRSWGRELIRSGFALAAPAPQEAEQASASQAGNREVAMVEAIKALLGCMKLAGWEDDPTSVNARALIAPTTTKG